MLERNSKLINKKFYQYLIPSILTIFAIQFASLLDGIIVGNMLGVIALSATSLVIPILYFIQMPGFALGIGGSIVVGILLGKRDLKAAKKAFSACILAGILISVIIAALAPAIAGPLAGCFSDDPEVKELGYEYIFIYMVTDPIITIALLMSSFLAVDNSPRLASFFTIFSNVIKIGSMFLFIGAFKWGMYGAAVSTAFGYFVGFLSLIVYVRSDKRLLKFTLNIKGAFQDLKDSLKASSSTAINMILTAIQMLIVNIVLGNLITDQSELLIFGVAANLVFAFDLFAGGILGVIPTICGVLYGEKDMFSLKSITRKIFFINLGVAALITLVIMIVPQAYAYIFSYDDPANIEKANLIMRIYLISFIPYELNKFSMNYYPTIGKNIPSYVTVILRETVIVLPVTLVLLYTNGLMGYAIAQVINEWATLLITYAFVLIYGRWKNKGSGLFLFEKIEYKSYDVSVDANIDNASIISKEIAAFALINKIDNKNAQIIALASEEYVSNIIEYGYKSKLHKQNYIDVNLKIIDDKLLLRIRDDGMPFDPTKYEFDSDGEKYMTSGINLVSKLTEKVSYMRVLSLNNTVIEMDLATE